MAQTVGASSIEMARKTKCCVVIVGNGSKELFIIGLFGGFYLTTKVVVNLVFLLFFSKIMDYAIFYFDSLQANWYELNGVLEYPTTKFLILFCKCFCFLFLALMVFVSQRIGAIFLIVLVFFIERLLYISVIAIGGYWLCCTKSVAAFFLSFIQQKLSGEIKNASFFPTKAMV